MANPIETPAPVTPKPEESTPEALHDAAISATEAWQSNPTDETKAAAVSAVAKAKEALKSLQQKSAAPEKKVPEKYDLKIKEGSKIDAAHLEKISAFAKAKGLSNEDAQALLDRDQENFSAIQSAQEAELQKIKDSWLPAAQADKEIGGDNFNANAELAKRVISRVGTDEFKQFLDNTGFGNHPEVIKVFYRLGKMMAEDQLVIQNTPVGGGKKSAEEVMYPNQN